MAKGGLGENIRTAVDTPSAMVGSGWPGVQALQERMPADHLNAADKAGHGGRSDPLQLGHQAIVRPRKVSAENAAESFVVWLGEHDLAREWAVDDVWFLAESDFAEALCIDLPPRRVFLGALKKVPGLRVTQNRRVRDRGGKVVRKTTIYDFAARWQR